MSTTSALSATGVTLDSDYLKLTQDVKSQNELDKDTFINLLCTQMKYQDPLNPMDNSEMLAQLAQFTALEQMMNVAQVGEKQLANSMIGKYVQYYHENSETGETTLEVGYVDYVDLSGDSAKLGIGENKVELDKVYSIVDSSNIQANTSAYELIGKTVQAAIEEKGADGKMQNVVIEGKVDSIQMKDGKPYVVIGTGQQQHVVEMSQVKNIVEKEGIIGKEVTGKYIDSTGQEHSVTGKVDYIKVTEDSTYVYIDGKEVDFDNITVIK